MKILFLNPHVDAQHPVAQGIERRGVAVLYPSSAAEAFQMLQLHGSSVDLAIIHREALPTYEATGIALIKKIKSDPSQADLPYILTTERWTDAECAQHQKTSEGANAYLRYPFTESSVIVMIEAVTGQKIGTTVTNTSATLGGAPPGVVMPANPKKTEAPCAPISHASELSGVIELSGIIELSESTGLDEIHSGTISGTIPTVASGSIPPMQEDAKVPTATFTRQGVATAMHPPGAPQNPEAIKIELSEPPSAAAQDTGSFILEAPPMHSHLSDPNPIQFQMNPEAPSSIEISMIGIGNEPDGVSMAPPKASVEQHFEPAISSSAPSAFEMQPEPAFTPAAPRSSMLRAPAVDEEALAHDLPYLFPRSDESEPGHHAGIGFSQPVGDAVVPGGAAHTPDLDTLKKYLMLREQDVAALSSQLRSTREQLNTVQESMKFEKARGIELTHTIDEQKRRIGDFERDKSFTLEGMQVEIAEMRFQMKAKGDRARILEAHVKEAADEMERLKDRVRTDIRKIRVREKELESKLEIMKKDAEALIAARENKIIELKRKLDLMEFNMDLLQDKYTREKDNASRLRDRLTKAAQAVRVAGGVLDPSVTGELKEGETAAVVATTSDRRAAS